MPYDPQRHHRRSIRLAGYDYGRAGAYYVTICVQQRLLLFESRPVREMILRWWDRLPGKFPGVAIDAFVVMPNHVHGIIVIVEAVPRPPTVGVDPRVDPDAGQPHEGQSHGGQSHGIAPTGSGERMGLEMGEHTGSEKGEHAGSPLHTIVQWFKTMTTNEYIRGVKGLGWTPFPGRLWQRNYWEHIIRNERDLAHVREYIANNPARWAEDRLHPNAPHP